MDDGRKASSGISQPGTPKGTVRVALHEQVRHKGRFGVLFTSRDGRKDTSAGFLYTILVEGRKWSLGEVWKTSHVDGSGNWLHWGVGAVTQLYISPPALHRNM